MTETLTARDFLQRAGLLAQRRQNVTHQIIGDLIFLDCRAGLLLIAAY